MAQPQQQIPIQAGFQITETVLKQMEEWLKTQEMSRRSSLSRHPHLLCRSDWLRRDFYVAFGGPSGPSLSVSAGGIRIPEIIDSFERIIAPLKPIIRSHAPKIKIDPPRRPRSQVSNQRVIESNTMSELQIVYKDGKPTCGVYEGMVFSLSFNRNAAGKGKGAWIGETLDSEYYIVHSGNYIVAVFPGESNDNPQIFNMNPEKQKTVNGIKSGVLRA